MSASAADTAGRRFGQYGLAATGLIAASVLALVGQALLAYYFGATGQSDALFMARDIAQVAARLTLPAQSVGILIPIFLAAHRHRPIDAWKELSAAITAGLIVSIPVAAAVVVAAPELVDLFAPGFDDATADRTADLLRLLSVTVVLILGGALNVGVLQAQERFGRAMGTNIAGQLALVASLPPLATSEGIRGAAIALVISAGVQWLAGIAFVLREGLPLAVNPLKHLASLRTFGRRALPFLAVVGASMTSALLYRMAASALEAGAFAALAFALRLQLAVHAILFNPITMVIFPVLSAHAAAGDLHGLRVELRASIRYVIFLYAPVSIALIVLAGPLVSAIFERGRFNADAASDTALATAAFALTLLPKGLQLILEQAAYARGRRSLVVGTNVTFELLTAALYWPAAALLGIAGIPLAMAFGLAFGAGLYFTKLYPSELRSVRRVHGSFLVRVAICACVMAATVVGVAAAVDLAFDPRPGLAQLIVVLPAAIAGLVGYACTAALLRLRELPTLISLTRDRLPLG